MPSLNPLLWLLAIALPFALPLSTPPNPQDFSVYAFSQSDVMWDDDPQVYALLPDVTIRAIGKWSTNGTKASDYNFAQIARYHNHNITFMGSGTASVIFPHDFPTLEIYDDMSTYDAEGNPVPHDEFGFPVPARRGNLFNPSYRNYLLSWAKLQIDGGVDGINFDEVNGGYSGGQKWGFNGNEGFDDYTLADFNRYLLAKYPDFTIADWQGRFAMTPENILSETFPPDDLLNNFNYRSYLQHHNWSHNPLASTNPLSAEWGKVTSNRVYPDTSFLPTYIRFYWTSLTTTLRDHSLSQRNRTLLISSNGIWPGVSFNSVGLYPWNPDEVTPDFRGADYVPVLTTTSPNGTISTHLNGSKSLKSQFRYLKSLHRNITSSPTNPSDDNETPIAIFIDWPNDMMTNYQSLPANEKNDYWRIFGAEAYANGLFPAFHLKDTVGGMTAKEAGILEFLVGYAGFFRRNGGFFTRNVPVDMVLGEVKEEVGFGGEGKERLVGSVLVQMGSGRQTVHIVNHDYEMGVMRAAEGVVVEVGIGVVGGCPKAVEVVSPDFAVGEVRAGKATCEGGKVKVEIGRVIYYSVLVFRM
ncbi:hypothetical protein B0T14DRAFT_565823 [Immersiella caudata]|uniref:Uncharacterized protein n=1 Tax=Immersiella caudata TaxID=314043 RepID=A0AA39WP22_9PEZI|nr:hypothetical protein B0T14DRAFT_565823 [Immersiella caudata]